jgi:DNA-binding NarL/FixJ family response regulator
VRLAGDQNGVSDLRGTRIAVVDRFTLYSDALSELLTVFGAVVERFDGMESTLDSALESGFAGVVADVDGPDVVAFDTVREARARGIATPVVALSASRHPATRRKAIVSGFQAVVARTESVEEITRVVATVCRGEIDFVHDACRTNEIAARALLTPRERDVLLELVRGSSTREIATRLSIRDFTARTYVQRVLVKMGVHSRAEAVILAVHGGVIPALSVDMDPRRAG